MTAAGNADDCIVEFRPIGIRHIRYQKLENGKWREIHVPHE